ncbi:MAG TPA: hypothetical protein EYP40_08690 [Chromatiales bacterium]|nr:hypothetical protein [Chromatiales bacterium]
MDETEYRNTYRRFNQRRCVFEKAINARRCTCSLARRFNLADREGVACSDAAGNQRCDTLLGLLRRNASFALQMTRVPGPLPHAKEMKVQVGGLLGLQRLLRPARAGSENVEDIDGLNRQAIKRYGSLEDLPFSDIVKSVVKFRGRQRESRRNRPKPE